MWAILKCLFNILLNFEYQNQYEHYKMKNDITRRPVDIPLSRTDGRLLKINIHIGFPGEKLECILSTEMYGLIVPISARAWGNSALPHSYYKPEESITMKKHENKFTSYFFGEIKGDIYSDTFAMSGIMLTDFKFGTVKEYPLQIQTAPFDCIVGIGGSALKNHNLDSLLEIVRKNYPEFGQTFSIYLNSNKQSENVGLIRIGGMFTEYLKNSDFVVAYVKSELLWHIEIRSMFTKSKMVCDKGCDAIIDITTPFIEGPSVDIQQINSILGFTQTDAKKKAYIKCSDFNLDQKVTYHIGFRPLTLEKHLLYYNAGGDKCLSIFQENDSIIGKIRYKIGLAPIYKYTYVFGVDYESKYNIRMYESKMIS